MGFINIFDNFGSKIKQAVNVFNGADEQAAKERYGDPADRDLGIYAPWFFSALYGQPRGENLKEVRDFSKSSWVRMVIDTILKSFKNIEWDIVTVDPEDDIKDYKKDKDELINFFNKVNRDGEDIIDLAVPTMKDVLEIDAGVIVKGRNEGGKLKELWYRDGATFLMQRSIYGPLLRYWQYSWRHPTAAPFMFDPKDLIYFMENPSTYRLYGFSGVQAIQQIVDLLIQSVRFNKDFFVNNAIPDALISLPNADQAQLDQFKTDWNNKIKGKPHKIAFHNTDMKFQSMATTNKDMEWLNGQKWYMHLCYGVFGLSPSVNGFSADVNRASQGGQERTSILYAMKPRLTLFEKKVNTMIIPDFLGQEHPKIKFKFLIKDVEEEERKHKNSMEAIDRGAITINEYRSDKGFDTVEWGDEPPQKMSLQMDGMNFNNQDKPKPGESPTDKPNDNPKDKDKEKDKKDDKKGYSNAFEKFMKKNGRT